MKKYVLLLILVSGLVFPRQTLAQTMTVEPTISPIPSVQITGPQPKHPLLQEMKKNVREEVKIIGQDLKQVKMSLAHLTNAKVASVSAPTLMVIVDNQPVIVTTSLTTRIARHFWGNAAVADIKVNDTLNIIGTWSDSSHSNITALMIRDESLVKTRGVIIGKIKSFTGSTLVVTTLSRGDQAGTFDTTTKVITRKELPMKATDIKVGDIVRVKGMIDKDTHTITQITEIRDFSYPPFTPLSITPAISSHSGSDSGK